MDDLRRYIIKKLFRGGYWGRRLLNFDDFVNPKTPRKELARSIKELVNEGFLFFKKGDKSSVFRYSLNPKMKNKIEEMMMDEFL